MSRGISHAEERYVFGGYEIVETTGSGGMGVVYRAMDVTLGRTVALKILRDELRAQPQIIARFKQEAKAFARLDHPNIVRVYSVGTVGRIPYIAMEFIEGVSLSDMLMANGPMSWREALGIGAQVAAALACAHDAMIVHRDIKPANIIIDKAGAAHVTDFGIAKILNTSSQLTQDGTRLGTPQYMCPERCRNKEVSPASDIYSLGVLLFQCISGRLPFEAANPVELIQKIAHNAPARLRSFAPDVPDQVERLIAHMIEKNPQDRPKNAHALRAAIERVLHGLPLDEQADQMSSAIAAFRGSLPHAPQQPRREATTEMRPKTKVLEKVRRGWFGLGKTARAAIAGAVLLLALAGTAALLQPVWRHIMTARNSMIPALHAPQDINRWFHAPPVARFKEETPLVSVAHFSLPDFEPAGIHWAGGFSDAVAVFTGVPNSPRQGQRMAAVLTPSVQDAAIVVPPLPDGHAASFRFLSGGAAATGEPGVYLATGTRTVFMGLTGGAVQTIRDYPAAMMTPNAQDETAAFVRAHAGNRWTLESGPLNGVLKDTELATHTAPITQLAYHSGNGAIAYVCGETNGQKSLWLYQTQGGRNESARLLQGNVRIAQAPFHPGGRSLLCAVETAPGEHVIQEISAVDGAVITAFGPGEEAAWRPQGDCCIALARDHANRLQVWAIDAAPPHQRTQLTFLDSGVKTGMILAEDGSRVLVPVPQVADVVMVRLEGGLF